MSVSCPNCDAKNPEKNSFCGHCGVKLANKCGLCGTENPGSSNFCGNCGTSLTAGPPQNAALLTSHRAAQGERKLVTVLFADICKSTELVEHLDPEQAANLLRLGIDAMIVAVHKFGGTVNKTQGDGIMALFGAPIAHEDHAARASFAALAIQETISNLEDADLIVRVGLNSGEVLVRSIGNDMSMDYDAIGQTVHLAARMEQVAKPGTIILAPATRRLAEGAIQVNSVGVQNIKGIAEPIELYQLTGAVTDPSTWASRSARGLSNFVGRQRELDTLTLCLDNVVKDRGALATVIGEPGQGKSRLIHEFSQLALSRNWPVLRTETAPHGTMTPYLSFGRLLRSMLAVKEHDDQAQIAQRVVDRVTSIDRNLAPIIPALQFVLDVPVADQGWHDLDPQLRRRRIIDGLKALCLAQAKLAPFVLIFEDLHWIDSESQTALDGLVDAVSGVPIMIVGTYRPEYRHNWTAKSYYTRIRLNPLDQGPVLELLNELIGTSAELSNLKMLLFEHTGGVPLFLEETVRSLAESGFMEGKRGDYKIVKPITGLQIPDSIQSVIAARIDRLSPHLKDILQTASVIGRIVPTNLLLVLSGMSIDNLQKGLNDLVAAEFLYESGIPAAPGHSFKHALTELVAYDSLLIKRRRDLHHRLVEIIEKEYADRIEEHFEELGHHSQEAEDFDKAYQYNLLAARKAHARSAYGQAIVFFESASAALDALPTRDNSINDKIDIRLEMRTALWPLGDHEKLYLRVCEARELAKAANETARLANVNSYLTAHFWQGGKHDLAVKHGHEAIRLAESAGDFSVLVTSQQHLGLAYLSKGDYHASTDLHRKVANAFTGSQAFMRHGMAGYPSALSRGFLVRGLSELGAFEEALKWSKEGLELAEQVNSVMTEIWVKNDVAMFYLRSGSVDSAILLLEINLDICRNSEVWLLASLTAGVLGHALTLSGDLDRAQQLLEEAVEPSVLSMCPEGAGFPFVWLGECYLNAGRPVDARRAGEKALDIAIRQGENGHRAWALWLLGRTALHSSKTSEEAKKWLSRARKLAEKLDMSPLMAKCDSDLKVL